MDKKDEIKPLGSFNIFNIDVSELVKNHLYNILDEHDSIYKKNNYRHDVVTIKKGEK
jgi:hypothetical protein